MSHHMSRVTCHLSPVTNANSHSHSPIATYRLDRPSVVLHRGVYYSSIQLCRKGGRGLSVLSYFYFPFTALACLAFLLSSAVFVLSQDLSLAVEWLKVTQKLAKQEGRDDTFIK